MTALAFSDITAVLASRFASQISRQMNRSIPLASVLPVYPHESGQTIQWAIEHGADVGGVVADGADISTYNKDTKAAATLNFGIYSDAIQLNGFAMAAAQMAGNPSALVNLLAHEVGNSAHRLGKIIGTDIYSGATSGGIVGLNPSTTVGAVGSTGTYAGVIRGSVTQWAGNYSSNGGVARPLSFDLMRTMMRTIYVASGEKPNLIVCDPVSFQNLGKLYDSGRQFNQNIQAGVGKIILDAGYNALSFDGVAVLEDVNCQAGKMYFLNLDHVSLVAGADSSTMVGLGMGSVAVQGHAESQLGANVTKLSARLNPLARAGDHIRMQLITYVQLKCDRPNSCGVLADLEITA